ncbi:hypothetical protein EUGRSUZ_E01135 [Eucalyptus grandis]|uniref:Uncharacterized protein n=2 Tax=Eucalyptus grandis TaxID=71139 RepID=A0ACC3KTL6_EUCGR|nr:hypothetical protein EUGRSUZ_E01135 [Eucalyptus grandis]
MREQKEKAKREKTVAHKFHGPTMAFAFRVCVPPHFSLLPDHVLDELESNVRFAIFSFFLLLKICSVFNSHRTRQGSSIILGCVEVLPQR